MFRNILQHFLDILKLCFVNTLNAMVVFIFVFYPPLNIVWRCYKLGLEEIVYDWELNIKNLNHMDNFTQNLRCFHFLRKYFRIIRNYILEHQFFIFQKATLHQVHMIILQNFLNGQNFLRAKHHVANKLGSKEILKF